MSEFEQTEDGRYILTAEEIGNLQASEFKVGWEAGYRSGVIDATTKEDHE